MKTPEIMAKELLGNWEKFQSFAWNNEQVNKPKNYCIVYTKTRDSNAIETSNHNYIDKQFLNYINQGIVLRERHTHWALGYLQGFAIPVYNENNEITDAFKLWVDIQNKLDEHPILDEDDYNNLIYEYTLENIGAEFLWEDLEGELLHDMYLWLCKYRPNEMNSVDGYGAYPTRQSVIDAYCAITGEHRDEFTD